MRADDPSVPDPPGQSTVRVLRGADGVALTNEPDPDRLAFDRRFDGPGGGPSLNSEAVARGISCLSAGAKGFGFVVLGLGAMILIGMMIGTIFFDVPMKFNKRMVGKREALGIQAGFLVFWAAFGTVAVPRRQVLPGGRGVLAAGVGGRGVGAAARLFPVRTGPGGPSGNQRVVDRPEGEGGRGDGRRGASDPDRADDRIRGGLGRQGALGLAGAAFGAARSGTPRPTPACPRSIPRSRRARP